MFNFTTTSPGTVVRLLVKKRCMNCSFECGAHADIALTLLTQQCIEGTSKLTPNIKSINYLFCMYGQVEPWL